MTRDMPKGMAKSHGKSQRTNEREFSSSDNELPKVTQMLMPPVGKGW